MTVNSPEDRTPKAEAETENTDTRQPSPSEPETGQRNWPTSPARPPSKEKEIGGREGPDPTRYDDWEKGGRCIDF